MVRRRPVTDSERRTTGDAEDAEDACKPGEKR
jgi:hypothetical protein